MAFLSGLQGIGDIVGIIGALQQQAQQRGLGNELGGVISGDENMANQLFQSYTGFTLPELQQTISTLQPEQQQAWNAALSSLTSAGGAATALQSNPYLSKEEGVANQLLNFNPLTTSQLDALSTQAGGAARSAAETARAQMGGVANPAALMKSLVDQAGGVSDTAAVQLGAQTAAQRLNAVTAGGSLLDQISNQFLSGNSAAGSLFKGIGDTQAGMSSTALSGILQSLGISSQALSGATALQGQAGSLLGGLIGGAPNATAGLPSLFGGLGSSLQSIFGNHGGGSSVYTPPTSGSTMGPRP